MEYRRLRKGERIQEHDEVRMADDFHDPWEPTVAAGYKVGVDSITEGCIYRRRKAPKPKAPKPHTWEPRTMEIGPKVTKQVLVDLVQESVNEINQLGTENAKLKNQIAALRRKQKGTK